MEWNGEPDDLLRQLRQDGDSFGIIHRKFLARGYRVTKNSLIGRATRLKLQAPRQPTQYLPRYNPVSPGRPRKTNGHRIIESGAALTDRLKRIRPAAGRTALTNNAPDPAAGEFLGLTLFELTYKTCRYPDGEPTLFCGQPPLPGSPYCAKHHAMCFC